MLKLKERGMEKRETGDITQVAVECSGNKQEMEEGHTQEKQGGGGGGGEWEEIHWRRKTPRRTYPL